MYQIKIPYSIHAVNLHKNFEWQSYTQDCVTKYGNWFNNAHILMVIRKLLSNQTSKNTMRSNSPKLLDLLIFCIYSLNFSLDFYIMIFLM